MKSILFLFFAATLLPIFKLNAQKTIILNKDQFENLAESTDSEELADESYTDQLAYFQSHPINLNIADRKQLIKLQILNDFQIENFLSYRKLLGKIKDLHELQAIPGWDLYTISEILPFVTLGDSLPALFDLKKEIFKGQSKLQIRYSEVLQRAKGYIEDSASNKHYLGSPAKILLRYNYNCKNLFQYSFTASKDAGEQFFRGSQQSGFDFYSLHLFFKNFHHFKSIAVGDFTVNIGQGLIQWQSMGFKKSSQVMNIERQSDVINPYASHGQVNYHRGLGINWERNHFGTAFFVSVRKLDATFKTDSLGLDFVSSLQNSGYHRTSLEISHQNKLKQFSTGASIYFDNDQFHAGFNSVYYHFNVPIIKSPKLYNKYVFSGTELLNTSFDISARIKFLHFFGEAATDNQFHPGLLAGILMALDRNVDVSFLYRNISRAYHSLYSNAFTENAYPVNEKGYYAALKMIILPNVELNAYTDIFSFPWVKYRVDLPSAGKDQLIQLNYVHQKSFKSSLKFRVHSKPTNYNPENLVLSPVIAIPTSLWKLEFTYTLGDFEIGCRNSILKYASGLPIMEKGFVWVLESGYFPKDQPYYISMNYEYFETDGSKSKIYASEGDGITGVAVSGVSGKGNRLVLNINYELTKKMMLSISLNNNYYPEINTIGTGWDLINGHLKTELKTQFSIKF